ncbi:multi-sensor hybrid histidine kinase [Pelobacter propionicus DSM 2379]|uniref:histidine kinase n=1 Tax=Pelobacter propionicus (strain DSM 2379 / NBRC 103807 / OttBd1) TaxID=338966 RepID=A1AK36_PELPD|nr:multi-sensor hybrid histidine kinase [Pelobacter propionicus DSM 2379]
MKRHDTSVTKIIVLTLVAVMTIVLSAFGSANYYWERSQRTGDLEYHLTVISSQLASSLALPLWNFDTKQVDKVIESTMRHPDVFGVIVRGADGVAGISGFVRDPQWRAVPSKGEIRNRGLLSRTEKISIHGSQVGVVHLFMTPRFLERSMHRFAINNIVAIVTLNVFLVFIPFQLIRRNVIIPLQAIETYALKVSSGEAEAADVPEGDFFGELNNLNRSIVGMTRSLAEARQEQVRKTAEQVLRESETILRAFIDVMPVGVRWSDSDDVIKHVNTCFIEMFGYTAADIPTLDEWFLRAYPDPDRREYISSRRKAVVRAALVDGTPIQPLESIIACKDGSDRHVIVNTQFSRDLRLDIFTDITERESLQNRLLNAQRLESLGVLAGGIAHDFNNILTGIMGNISMARMVLAMPGKSDKLLDNAEKAALRATELATQLLTFAKGGAPVKKTVSIRKIVDESLSLAIRGTNVKGVVQLPDSLHDIEADEGQVSQVFNNIVINAVQAMPGGGEISVHGMNVVLGSENRFILPPGDYVKLSFTDQGCGMPEDVRKKIFDPYFTTKSHGMGLGLASVHSIVKRHGGYIDVRSTIGEGTTFTLLLPSTGKTSLEEETGERVTQCDVPAEGAVLVMDDEEMIRELAAEILGHLGYEVTTCASGEEAIRMYLGAKEGNKPFSYVIMDLTVPGGMGGRESAAEILAFDPCARLIASSGYSNNPVMASFRDYGFCGAIVKPYTPAELARVVHSIVAARV